MRLSETTHAKLLRVQSDLGREFPHIPEERIAHLMAGLTIDVIEPAEFDDFVPLLIHRGMRKRLATQAEAVTSQAAT